MNKILTTSLTLVMILLFSEMFMFSFNNLCVTAQEQPGYELIGTYTVNYRFNAAGGPPELGGDYNPWYFNEIPPGPYFLDPELTPPGKYRAIVTAWRDGVYYGNAAIWDGDAQGGSLYPLDYYVGYTQEFDHAYGQIVIYAIDWYPWDNSADSWTVVELWREVPSAKISSVTTNSGGSLDTITNSLAFAGGDDWGNTDPDVIQAIADVPDGVNTKIHWTVTTAHDSGIAQPSSFTTDNPNEPFQFRIRNLPSGDYLYSQRPPLSFTITAQLLDDSNSPVGNPDSLTIVQNALGQRRQEYVDHPVNPVGNFLNKVPRVEDFNSNLEIISEWAKTASEQVLSEASKNNIQTVVTSIYRNPVHHWNIYLQIKGKSVTRGSRHMWGLAVDFAVHDNTQKTYIELAKICRSLGYHVVFEGTFNHVHIQMMT